MRPSKPRDEQPNLRCRVAKFEDAIDVPASMSHAASTALNAIACPRAELATNRFEELLLPQKLPSALLAPTTARFGS